MNPERQRVRRVWENELEYEERADIKAKYDPECEEWFKVIVEETDRELEMRLALSGRKEVRGQIEKIREKLNGLENQLDIFNTYGLQVITENLDKVDIALFHVVLNNETK